MVTVTEQPRPSSKLDVRLEELRRGLGMREQARDRLLRKIEDTRQQEEEAVSSAITSAPRHRAYKKDAPALTLKAALVGYEDELKNLEVEISALAPILKEEVDRERQSKLGRVRARLHELGNKELLVWEQSAEIVDEVIASWNAYREILEERSAIYQEAIHSGVLAAGENESYRELQDLVMGQIGPANSSIMSFVARILDVTLDPDGLGYRDAGGRPSDGNRLLPGLLPDKRSQLRKLEVGGGVFELR